MKNKCRTLYQLADKAGMSAKTARKYLKSGLESKTSSKTTPALSIRTPYGESKSLFEALQREYPGKYQDAPICLMLFCYHSLLNLT